MIRCSQSFFIYYYYFSTSHKLKSIIITIIFQLLIKRRLKILLTNICSEEKEDNFGTINFVKEVQGSCNWSFNLLVVIVI